MKKHRYDHSPAYKHWVQARDKAAEQLLINAQAEQSDVMRHALTQVLTIAKSYYYELKNPGHLNAVDRFESQVKDVLRHAAGELYRITHLLKLRAYTLAKTSETEIIAQLNPKRQIRNELGHHDLVKKSSEPSFAGGDPHHRILMYLDRLARKIITMAQSSAINSPDMNAFLFYVLQTFPERKVYKRPPRVLKSLREADFPLDFQDDQGDTTQADAALDFIDEGAWADMVDAYKNDYIPKWRGPEYIVDIPVTDPTEMVTTGEQVWYAWEFERDLTNEFVQSVRDGQIDSANQAGITDFVWVAVIDSVTDACCRWRDGLLVSEIEDQLSAHQGEDDECNLDNDGLTPPIHFNCRCTLAPATDSIPDKPDDGAKDFEEWLDS